MTRFGIDLGGTRAVVTNVVVDLESWASSAEGLDDPCDLKSRELHALAVSFA